MMILRGTLRVLAIGVIVGVTLMSVHMVAQTASPARAFTLDNVEASGVKVWLPSAVVVHPGDQVTLTLENKLDAVHGFSIDEYGIQVVIPAGGTQEVKFTAKRGASRFYCQLHPAHLGGYVVVM